MKLVDLIDRVLGIFGYQLVNIQQQQLQQLQQSRHIPTHSELEMLRRQREHLDLVERNRLADPDAVDPVRVLGGIGG